MQPEALTPVTEHQAAELHIRVAWLCGVVLFLEGYDIAAVGYAIPSLTDAWQVRPPVFTPALTAGNVGLLIGSLGAGLLGDRLGRKPVLIGCVVVFGVFSLLSSLVGSPSQLAGLRFLTGLGLGGGVPLAIALASDFAPPMAQGRLVILMSAGVPIGFAVGGLLASQLVRVLGWPAIFVVGGVLPLAIVPLLTLRLPESVALHSATRRNNLVRALFQNGLAPRTVLLWRSICSVSWVSSSSCCGCQPSCTAPALARLGRSLPRRCTFSAELRLPCSWRPSSTASEQSVC